MYGVHIRFKDGSNPFTRFDMNREEYCKEMKKWKEKYVIEVENAETLSTGDKLIFFSAEEIAEVIRRKKAEDRIRSRYYSRLKHTS